MTLDTKDAQLLALLKQNSRESVVALSRKLGVSRATVQSRIESLERRKIIKGYTVVFDEQYDSRLIRALMSINLKAGTARDIIAQLRNRPQVSKILSVSGLYDLVLELTVESTAELDSQIDEIRELEGIEHTVTSIILSDYR